MVGGLKALSTNCGATHATQRYVLLEQDSELNPVITIGWVDFQGNLLFKTSRETLEREIEENKNQRSSEPLDYHAWFTLRDGDAIQIIDCTLGYYLLRKGLLEGAQIWQFSTESPEWGHEGVEYYPLLAGQKTLEAVGELDYGFNPLKGA